MRTSNVADEPRCSPVNSGAVGSIAVLEGSREWRDQGTLQAKFAASFVLPTPLYCAVCG